MNPFRLATGAVAWMAWGSALFAGDRLPQDSLIPKPVRLEPQAGSFELTATTSIFAGPGTKDEALALATALEAATGLSLAVSEQAPRGPAIRLELDPGLDAALGGEGYRLSVSPGGVRIHAAHGAGVFYGTVTLRQLFPIRAKAESGEASATVSPRTLPGVEIEDRPRFRWRGLLLDPARHFLPVEFLRRFLDLMALHKLNVLQLHLTDDQGWRLELRQYPRLTAVGSVRKESPKRGDRNTGDGTPYGPFFYTQGQIRELVAYAAARHVTVVPEIEMPGHLLAALTAYPQFSCTGGPFEVRTRWGVEPGSEVPAARSLNPLRAGHRPALTLEPIRPTLPACLPIRDPPFGTAPRRGDHTRPYAVSRSSSYWW